MGNNKFIYLWVIGLGVLTYLWTLFFGFTYFDDNTLILNNLYFLRNLGNIPVAFTTEVFHILHSSAAYYRPLLTISFMLDAQLAGSSPFLYHLTNIVIHIFTSCLVFAFLQKVEVKKDTAFVFSLIFAVHPVLTQAVSWIPGRNDSLLTMFVVLSIIFFINYLKLNKTKYLIWHLIFFMASVFTKESGVLVAPVIVLYILLFKNWKILLDRFYVLLIWGAGLGTWFVLRSYSLKDPIQYTLSETVKSLYLSLPIVILDLGKVIFPFNLSVLPTLQDSTLIWGFISTVLIVTVLLLSKNKNYKWITFGLLWFLAFLLPSFIRPSTEYVPDFLEHRIYLPIIGLFIILNEVKFIKEIDLRNKKSKIIIGIFISFLVVVNFMHTSLFKDRLTFWKSAAETSPHHPLAHKNLGAMYYLDGNLDKAEEEYEQSLALNPEERMIHNNLGLIYADRGDLIKAEEHYKKELEINPYYDNTLYNYGLLLYKDGRKEEAEKMWLKTLSINPDYVDAMKNLFILYYQRKDTQKANYYYIELQKRGIDI